MNISLLRQDQYVAWTDYVASHPGGTLYHLPQWKNIIEKTYGHQTYYLLASRPMESPNRASLKALRRRSGQCRATSGVLQDAASGVESISGILPLVHLKHPLFGNSLISIPFADLGGILADDKGTEGFLLAEAVKLGRQLKVKEIELRDLKLLQSMDGDRPTKTLAFDSSCTVRTKSHKVRMLLELPDTPEMLMKSFRSKLRSQIKKPLKDGLVSRIGGLELLEDFYRVFTVNMRDLGSPVHAKAMMRNVLKEFPEQAAICMVYKGDEPLACSLVAGFGDTLENPWASALREYAHLSPNMLLYWNMLEYACSKGFRYFDFGRSTPDEGTYKFKEQWGAHPMPLHWHYISLDAAQPHENGSETSKFARAIQYWQKLPVPVSRVLGPLIRKHIGL